MLSILLGILGLGVIIFFHELGHFCAARVSGVTVEAFSIGMGPILLHKKIGETDFRLSLIPMGGYCAFKGEKDFQRALEEKLSETPRQKDSFYGTHPLKRMFIAFSGPFANFLFAIIAFTIIAMTSYSYQSAGNKIVLLTDYFPTEKSTATKAGVKTGDRITAINGEPVETFNKIVELVSVRPQETVTVQLDRAGTALELPLYIDLDTATGAGKIGIMSWIDPVVSSIEKKSPAAAAGLTEGDRIIAVDGIPINTTIDMQKSLEGKTIADLTVERAGAVETLTIVPKKTDDGNSILGIQFLALTMHSTVLPLHRALVQGIRETSSLFLLTLKSIASLFKGVDFTQAVSGPIRITVMLGDAAQSGFSAGFSQGIVTVLNFLALLSVSLFLMNLLPIPVLDGGHILFSVIELIRGKGASPRFLYAVQMAGLVVILLIAAFAVFSDFRYLFTR